MKVLEMKQLKSPALRPTVYMRPGAQPDAANAESAVGVAGAVEREASRSPENYRKSA
jgi:hypothetical protein